MHKVLLESRAERDLDRLPSDEHDRIMAALLALGENPRPHGCLKLAGTPNGWRVRVGRYRVLYRIDDSANEVWVTAALHRKDAYR